MEGPFVVECSANEGTSQDYPPSPSVSCTSVVATEWARVHSPNQMTVCVPATLFLLSGTAVPCLNTHRGQVFASNNFGSVARTVCGFNRTHRKLHGHSCEVAGNGLWADTLASSKTRKSPAANRSDKTVPIAKAVRAHTLCAEGRVEFGRRCVQ